MVNIKHKIKVIFSSSPQHGGDGAETFEPETESQWYFPLFWSVIGCTLAVGILTTAIYFTIIRFS